MRDLQAPRSEAAESGSGRAKEPGVLEEDADVALNRVAKLKVASARMTVGPDGSGFGAFQEHGLISRSVCNLTK